MEKNTPKQLAPVNGTPFDYLRWRGDLTFARDGFNEVDNLVLCILSYINFRRIDAVHTKDPAAAPTLAQVAPLLTDEDDQLGLSELSYLPLLRLAAQTERFRDLRLFGYTHEYDEQSAKQFDALSFLVPDGTLFVAFMGTDTSLAGWKEDFNMSFLSAVPAQTRAVSYATEMASLCPALPLRIGGHSKGGNLAAWAAIYLPAELQKDRLLSAYNNDGPGFAQDMLDTPEYRRVADKLHTYIRVLHRRRPAGTRRGLRRYRQRQPFHHAARAPVLERGGHPLCPPGPAFPDGQALRRCAPGVDRLHDPRRA